MITRIVWRVGGKVGLTVGQTAGSVGEMCGGREKIQGSGGRIEYHVEYGKDSYHAGVKILERRIAG